MFLPEKTRKPQESKETTRHERRQRKWTNDKKATQQTHRKYSKERKARGSKQRKDSKAKGTQPMIQRKQARPTKTHKERKHWKEEHTWKQTLS